jgi:uncharacterized delta-60 repeat protein
LPLAGADVPVGRRERVVAFNDAADGLRDGTKVFPMHTISIPTPAIRERVRQSVFPLLAFALSLLIAAPVAAQDIFAIDAAPKTSVRNRTEWSYKNLHELPGGKLLVLGSFKFVDGTVIDGIARLHLDGSLDPSFTAPYAGSQIIRCGVIGDGRIVILVNLITASGFQSVIQRLLPDGAIDPTFATLDVSTFSTQVVLGLPDGGAYILSQRGPNSMRALRVLPNGQLDPTYSTTPLAGSFINSGAVSPSGELALFRVTGAGAASVEFLSPAGIMQPAFTGIPANFRANAGVFEPSGALVLSGSSSNGAFSPSLVRILPTGARDDTFDGVFPFANGVGSSVVRLTDGTFMAMGPGTPTLPAVVHFSAAGEYIGGIMSMTMSGMLGMSGLGSSTEFGAYAYGSFAALDGVAAPNIARIAANRSIDPTFMADITGFGRMHALARYRDGFLVAGAFSEIGEQDIFNLATFGADDSFGTVMPYFPPGTQRALGTADGGAVLLGSFPPPFTPGPGAVGALKLRADGTLNPLFMPTLQQGTIEAAVEQPDGRLVFAGRADGSVSGGPVLNLFRTGADGILDPTFNNLSPISGGIGIGLTAVAVDEQGRIVVAGSFTTFQGVARPGLARVTTDGVVDPTFAPTVGLTNVPRNILFLPDGSFYVAGNRSDNPFETSIHRFNDDGSLHASQLNLGLLFVGGFTLHPDGSLFITTNSGVIRVLPSVEIDPLFQCTFNLSADSPILVDELGRVLVTGVFSTVNGEPHEGIVRFARVPFGVRIEGPASRTLRLLDTLRLTTSVAGARAVPAFKWFHDGVPITGATGSTLTVTHLVPKNEGAYTVSATSPTGTVTSAPITLSLIRFIPAK